jgi:hypothetical protein
MVASITGLAALETCLRFETRGNLSASSCGAKEHPSRPWRSGTQAFEYFHIRITTIVFGHIILYEVMQSAAISYRLRQSPSALL